MFNYEIGGNERKVDVSEGFADIGYNKTLFIQQLTDQEPLKPQTVESLKTVEEVFEHYKPQVEVEFENLDGVAVREELRFSNVGDFNVKNLVKQSNYLHSLTVEKDLYTSLIKNLKTNKALSTAFADSGNKEAFINALKNFVQELSDN